jgi:hypothetical protein
MLLKAVMLTGSMGEPMIASLFAAMALAATDTAGIHGVAVEAVGPPPEQTAQVRKNTDHMSVKVSGDGWSRVFEYYNLSATCEPAKFSISIEALPSHGEVKVVDSDFAFKEMAKRSFSAMRNGKSDPRRNCHAGGYPAKLVIYKPINGFAGSDGLSITVRDRRYESHEHMELTVVP